MNERIKELAEQAHGPITGKWWDMDVASLERFAALVRADEREACCAIVYGRCESDNVAQRTVDAIQARGTK